MSVLVTGGAGYIGSHMVHELLDHGEHVIVVDDLSTGFRGAAAPPAELVVGDIGDTKLIAGLLAANSVDSILHFAAKTVVPESLGDPLRYYQNNTASARTLLECAVAAGVKNFVFSSTAAVYGEPKRNPVREDDAPEPVSPYGRSKLMVEWMLADTARAHGLRYAALRYFNVAGADPRGRAGQSTANATHLIKVATQAALGMHARHRSLRHGLSDAGRIGFARLHPCQRSHPRPQRRARPPARGRGQPHLQLRVPAGLFRPRSHQRREGRVGRRFSREDRRAPGGRSRRGHRRQSTDQEGTRMDPPLR